MRSRLLYTNTRVRKKYLDLSIFGHPTTVDDITDITRENDVVTIFFRTNGTGKSTILKIITGVLNPTTGKVTINGRFSALLGLGVSFNIGYTRIENIYLNRTMIVF